MFLTNYIQFPSWIKKCTQYLCFAPGVLLLCFTALLSSILPSACFSNTCPLITLLSIAGILSALIFNCLAGDHQLSSTLLAPAARMQCLTLPHSLVYYLSCGSELRCIMSGNFFFLLMLNKLLMKSFLHLFYNKQHLFDLP